MKDTCPYDVCSPVTSAETVGVDPLVGKLVPSCTTGGENAAMGIGVGRATGTSIGEAVSTCVGDGVSFSNGNTEVAGAGVVGP